jgi:hypothetical protein
LRYIIKPASDLCGYKAIRADKISEPGLITSQVIQHIVDDHIVIADLTGRNPNVYYELAIRHAIRKPYVQLLQQGETLLFDIAGVRTIPVDSMDVAIVEEAKAAIVRQIQSLQGENATVDSPISTVVNIGILRGSGNPQDRQHAELLYAVTELRTAFSML